MGSSSNISKKTPKENDELRILHELALILNDSHDIDYIILQSANKFKEITNSTGCHILFIKQIRDCLQLETAIHSGPKPFPLGADETKGISGMAYNTGEIVIVSDAANDPRVTKKIQQHFGHKSVLAVPITVRGNIIGAVAVYSLVQDFYTSEMGGFLKMLGTHLGMAVENAKLLRELENAAITDPLTNVFNYRYFRKELEHIATSYCDLQTSLIMVDINDFKVINDTYGHLCGDRLLGSLAGIIKANIRENDIVARYGGDEFIIILPNTNIDQAYVTASRLEKEVANQEISYDCHKIRTSISWGISNDFGNEIMASLDNFIDIADRRLYIMKSLVKKGLSNDYLYT